MSDALNTPLVSVIVPMYGVEKYIAQCAESLFAQTYPAVEFIFVDDGGKDRAMEILRGMLEKLDPSLQARVRIISKVNEGLPRARKTGLDAATGEYVTFLDDDDVYLPEKVAHQAEAMRAAGADYSLTDLDLCDESGAWIGEKAVEKEVKALCADAVMEIDLRIAEKKATQDQTITWGTVKQAAAAPGTVGELFASKN